ncbi:hypothetical protein [Mycolicibacterium palauense]|uniref:hypothetical protein n=1 Tax=Mycolicibacterium palauense TaxID=2034511 RepID=UPI0011458CFB|nr:hypothetical protein [Mycolicibacterium palauense]
MSRPEAEVYRAVKRDKYGDPVNESGEVTRVGPNGFGHVGTVKGVMLGGLSASPSMRRGESSNTEGMIGIPNKRNGIKVKFGDQLLIDGFSYKVISPPRWDYEHSMSGSRPQYHWVQVVGGVD